jgi:hypothetical protein
VETGRASLGHRVDLVAEEPGQDAPFLEPGLRECPVLRLVGSVATGSAETASLYATTVRSGTPAAAASKRICQKQALAPRKARWTPRSRAASTCSRCAGPACPVRFGQIGNIVETFQSSFSPYAGWAHPGIDGRASGCSSCAPARPLSNDLLQQARSDGKRSGKRPRMACDQDDGNGHRGREESHGDRR